MEKIESDHNPIISKLALTWNKISQTNRLELFNLKNRACQEKFFEETSSSNNKRELSLIFEEKEDLNSLAEKFMKKLDKVIHKCFRKIRISEKKEQRKFVIIKTSIV